MYLPFTHQHFPTLPQTAGSFPPPSTPGIIISNIEINLTKASVYKVLKGQGINPTQMFIPRIIQTSDKIPLHLRGFAFAYFNTDQEARDAARTLRGVCEYYNQWLVSMKVNNVKNLKEKKDANLFFKNLRNDLTLKEFSDFLYKQGGHFISAKIKYLEGGDLSIGYAQYERKDDADNLVTRSQDPANREEFKKVLGDTFEITRYTPFKERTPTKTTIFLRDFTNEIPNFEKLTPAEVETLEEKYKKQIQEKLSATYGEITSLFVKVNPLKKKPVAFVTFKEAGSAEKALEDLPQHKLIDYEPYVNFQETKAQREAAKSRMISSLVQSNSQFVYMKNLRHDITEEQIKDALNANGFPVEEVRLKAPESIVDYKEESTKMANIKMRNEKIGEKLVNALNKGYKEIPVWAQNLFKNNSSYVSFLQHSSLLKSRSKRMDMNQKPMHEQYPFPSVFMGYPPFPQQFPPFMGFQQQQPFFQNFPLLGQPQNNQGPNGGGNYYPNNNFHMHHSHPHHNNSGNNNNNQHQGSNNNNNNNQNHLNNQQHRTNQPHQRQTNNQRNFNNNNYNNNNNNNNANNQNNYNNRNNAKNRSPNTKPSYAGNNNNSHNNQGYGGNNDRVNVHNNTKPAVPPKGKPQNLGAPGPVYVKKPKVEIDYSTPEQINANLESFKKLEADSQRAHLGRILYPKVQAKVNNKENTGKITGMLIDFDNFTVEEIIEMLNDLTEIEDRVKEAEELLLNP